MPQHLAVPHRLKSASARVGALAVALNAGEIKRLAREQRLVAAANLLEPLEDSVEMACRFSKRRSTREPHDFLTMWVLCGVSNFLCLLVGFHLPFLDHMVEPGSCVDNLN